MRRTLSLAVALLFFVSLASAVDLPSCAGRQAASKADCASPCYFFQPQGASAGTCAYGVLVVDEVSELGRAVPTSQEIQQVVSPSVAQNRTPAQQQRLAEVRQELAQGYEAMNARVKSAYDAEIERCAKRYGVPADRLRALICAESHFNPQVVSRTGASGLTQQQPCYAEDLVQHCLCVQCTDGGTSCNPIPLRRYGCMKQGVVPGSEDEKRLFDPESNICQGAKELKRNSLRFNSWECAEFAYLAGGAAASRYHCQPPSEDMGIRYIRRITAYYNAFRSGQCNACGSSTHC